MDDRLSQHTCVLTLQAARPGGVPTVVDWWVRYLNSWGYRATVLLAEFDGEEISLPQRIIRTLKHWHVRPSMDHPNPTLVNPAPPVPLWLFYFVPQWIFGPILHRFDQIVFAGGPVHAALPAALIRKPYILWMGTLYEDELRGKAAVGDVWAASILHNPFWRFLAWQETFVLKRAARVLPQSPFTLRRIAETLPQVQDRLDLVMVPTDMERFAPLPEEQRKGEYRYLLNVSRINDPRKNIPLLLEAFRQVSAQHSDLRLVLAGDDPEPPLLGLVDKLGLRERVVFEGKADAYRLADLYQRADLLVISSAQEGLGIVMLEAISCGTPVIATDCGGPEGIVLNGITGQIVPNHDVGKLTQAILGVLSDPAELHAMRQHCRKFACEHWSEEVVGRKLREHFVQTFSESDAKIEVIHKRPIATIFAAVWSLLIVAAYAQHQMALHWDSIQSQILLPLLNSIP